MTHVGLFAMSVFSMLIGFGMLGLVGRTALQMFRGIRQTKTE